MPNPKKKGMLEMMMEKMSPPAKATKAFGQDLAGRYKTDKPNSPMSEMFDPKKSKFAGMAKKVFDRFKKR